MPTLPSNSNQTLGPFKAPVLVLGEFVRLIGVALGASCSQVLQVAKNPHDNKKWEAQTMGNVDFSLLPALLVPEMLLLTPRSRDLQDSNCCNTKPTTAPLASMWGRFIGTTELHDHDFSL